MKIVINFEKKHLYFLLIFFAVLGIGVVIASTWDDSQSHGTLWTTAIKGKNVNAINVYDDLKIEDLDPLTPDKNLCLNGVCISSWPGGGGLSGTGTIGKLSKFTGSNTLGDSIIAESSGTATIDGKVTVTKSGQYTQNTRLDLMSTVGSGGNSGRSELKIYDINNPNQYIDIYGDGIGTVSPVFGIQSGNNYLNINTLSNSPRVLIGSVSNPSTGLDVLGTLDTYGSLHVYNGINLAEHYSYTQPVCNENNWGLLWYSKLYGGGRVQLSLCDYDGSGFRWRYVQFLP